MGDTGGSGKFVVIEETNGEIPETGRGEGQGEPSAEEPSMVGST